MLATNIHRDTEKEILITANRGIRTSLACIPKYIYLFIIIVSIPLLDKVNLLVFLPMPGSPAYFSFWILAQVSRKDTMRLNTSLSAEESTRSRQK